MDKVKQAQKICSKLQIKSTVLKKELSSSDKKAWNLAIKVILDSRQKTIS